MLALAAACAFAGTGQATGNGHWSEAPPMLAGRAAHAVVVAEGAVYALAGTGSNGQPVLSVERFDGHEWRVETKLPGHGLNAPVAAAIGPVIYLIGGFDTTTNVPTAQVQVYDTRAHSWRTVAPLPRPRGGMGATVLDGRIHVIGGGNSESTIADHSVYDPATDRWTERAPLPRPLGSPAAVVHEGALWSIGGRSGLDDFGNVWRYDSAGDRWLPGAPIPPRGTHGAVSACGAILVFGGESQPQQKVLADVLHLDAAHDTWTELEPMPTARDFARAVNFQDAVLVVGGSRYPGSSHESAGSTVVERFEPGC